MLAYLEGKDISVDKEMSHDEKFNQIKSRLYETTKKIPTTSNN